MSILLIINNLPSETTSEHTHLQRYRCIAQTQSNLRKNEGNFHSMISLELEDRLTSSIAMQRLKLLLYTDIKNTPIELQVYSLLCAWAINTRKYIANRIRHLLQIFLSSFTEKVARRTQINVRYFRFHSLHRSFGPIEMQHMADSVCF